MVEDDALLELMGAIRDLTRWLETSGIPHALVGGVAVAALGHARMTEDVDAVVLAGDKPIEEMLSDAERYGFVPRNVNPVEFAIANRMLLLQHTPDGIQVDVSLGWLPFEQELIARARPARLHDTEFPVTTAEDLLVMKILAFRGKDLGDIEAVLDRSTALDMERVRRWVGMLAEALDEPEISERLEALLARRASSTSARKKQ